MFGRILKLAVASLSIGSTAFAVDLSGTYSVTTPGGPLVLSLHEDQGKLVGTVRQGDEEFPIAATSNDGKLSGYWTSPRGAIPFDASLDGTHLVLHTNGASYQFQRGDPATPNAPAALDISGQLQEQPQLRWTDVTFPDNTGSISVPDGWRIVSTNNRCPGLFGPNGEIVALGQPLRYSANQLPYRGALESAKVIWTQFSDTFNPPMKFVRIIDARSSGQAADGSESADITFLGDLGRAGQTRRVQGHLIIVCTPPDARGNWSAIYSAMLAPQDSYDRVEPVMARIWNSWQLNTQQVLDNTRSQLAAQIAASRQSWAVTNAAIARAQHTMNVSGRQVEDFCNNMGGTGMAIDNNTGRLVPMGYNSIVDLNIGPNGRTTYRPFHVTPDP